MRIGLQAWGSEGDISPFTALAAALVEKGHNVTLVVADNVGRDYHPLADRFGYRLVPVLATDRPTPEDTNKVWRKIIDVGNPVQQTELVMRYGFDPLGEAMFLAARNSAPAMTPWSAISSSILFGLPRNWPVFRWRP